MGRRRKESAGSDRITATSDLYIASLFSAIKNEPLLLDLINAVLEDTDWPLAVEAKVLNPINVKEYFADKRIVLDIRVKDSEGRFYNIEVQTASHPSFIERIVFGWADSFSAQIHAGDDYTLLKPVLCIVILEYKFLDEIDGIHLQFELRERNHLEVVLTRHLQIHVLRLYRIIQGHVNELENVPPRLRRWMNFFAFGGTKQDQELLQLIERDPVIMTAIKELQHFAADPEMQELARRRRLWLVQYNEDMNAAHKNGEAKSKQDSILKFLKKSFGKVSPKIKKALRGITDLKTLDFLEDQAIDCQSLDEFVAHLPK